MNAHAVTYPSLQRRLLTDRRHRALFLAPTTQHLKSRAQLLTEISRAAAAVFALAAWCASLLLVAG